MVVLAQESYRARQSFAVAGPEFADGGHRADVGDAVFKGFRGADLARRAAPTRSGGLLRRPG